MNAKERLKRKNEFDGNLRMGGQIFNKLTKRDAHLSNISERKKKLIDPKTNQLNQNLIFHRECPVCNSDNSNVLFIKEGFPHVRCKSCGMVYVNCILKNDALNLLYQYEDTYSEILENEIQKEMDELKFQYSLDLIEKYTQNGGTLLDIGCGPGFFLSLARKRGWSVTGCEVNKSSIKMLQSLDISVIECPVEDFDFKDTYQCVTLFTVLEHIPDPVRLLKKIHQIIKKGGVLAILVPNVNAIANRILHEKSPTFSGDVHINFFSPTSLKHILNKTGFDVVECETFLTNIDTINNYLNFEDPSFGSGETVLPILTPEFIHDNLMGYQLFVLAQAT